MIMKHYRLKDILVMLYGQWKRDFKDLRVLMEILDNKKVSKIRLPWLMIAGLRALGLNELDYNSETIEEAEEQDIVADEITWFPDNLESSTEYIECKIRSGKITIEIFLN